MSGPLYHERKKKATTNTGTKTADARLTVVWNGKKVHDDITLDGPTASGRSETPAAGPIRLQDHGDPNANPRFRNIWIEPLG